MIQNAEDAGATEIKFILDSRQLKTDKIFGSSFKSLQGPALLCWNNSIFSSKDLNGIKNLGKGNKATDASKIGRFGVGVNVIYHYTDAPQFLSDFDNYVIFDPTCRHFPDMDITNPGCLIKNAKTNLKNSIFSDVLSGFEVNGVSLDKATLFRLPLRQTRSDISPYPIQPDEVRTLMVEFSRATQHVLIFLKNIKKIGFYEYDSSNSLKMINELDLEMTPEDITLKNNFRLNVTNNTKSFSLIEKASVIYKQTISSVSPPSKTNYLVLEQFGFDKSFMKQEDIARLAQLWTQKEEKYTPVASIAFKIGHNSTRDKYKLFNYLPLDQESPFPFHINAYFSLHNENRTHIYDYGLRDEHMNQAKAKWCTDWNLFLINFIVMPQYISLLDCLKQALKKNEIDIPFYLSMLPKLNNNKQLDPYFIPMLKLFYTKIHGMSLVPIEVVNVQNQTKIDWFQPAELQMTSNLEAFLNNPLGINDNIGVIFKILVKARIKVCNYYSLTELFRLYASINLVQLTYIHIVNGLKLVRSELENKPVAETFIENEGNLISLLQFCLRPIESTAHYLENCPLLIDDYSNVRCFSSSKKLLLHDYPQLFKGMFF
jgi:hypothetical protein